MRVRAGFRRIAGACGAFPQVVIPAKAGSALLRPSRTSSNFGAISPGRHSRESGLRFTSAEPNIQRLQAFSHERPWIPAFAGMTAGKSARVWLLR
ncbi:hypothetical protein [Lysobacter gummosus]|uniref:hypothetical protein n=1 Tax=Lysobacter gummosus TaxID=262324 RepID=UPI003644F99D